MKLKRWNWCALFVATLTLASAALPPRQDINPALLYFQALGQLPELTPDEDKLLRSDTVGDVTEEERMVARKFDATFNHLLRARTQKSACDWGIDPADGPHAFTPNYIKIRTTAYAAVLRARVALADGQPAQARDELLALSVLARHAATDAALVGVMIQVAVENKILDFISAQFAELKPAMRAELAAGLRAPPRRSTVADGMMSERQTFHEWFVGRLEGFRAAAGGDDAKAVEQFRQLMIDIFPSVSDDFDKIIDAAGGTSAGLIKYFKNAAPAYDRALVLARANAEDVKKAAREFEDSINSSTNLLTRISMPNFGKARMKELEFQARLSRLPDAAP